MSNDVSLDINQESNPVQTVAPPKEDNNMLRATDKITALYCRLSVEDTKEKGGKDDPSNSIQHQQIMLMEYAKSQHFPNPTQRAAIFGECSFYPIYNSLEIQPQFIAVRVMLVL